MLPGQCGQIHSHVIVAAGCDGKGLPVSCDRNAIGSFCKIEGVCVIARHIYRLLEDVFDLICLTINTPNHVHPADFFFLPPNRRLGHDTVIHVVIRHIPEDYGVHKDTAVWLALGKLKLYCVKLRKLMLYQVLRAKRSRHHIAFLQCPLKVCMYDHTLGRVAGKVKAQAVIDHGCL